MKMRMQLSGGVLFCLSVLAGCGGGGGGGGGNADCGESPSSTSCTINPAASVNEAISSAEDKDYYKVTVIQAGLLTAKTTGNTNTLGVLSDIAGLMITSDDNSGEGMNFRIKEFLIPGIYYIGVAGNSSSTGNYKLQTSIEIAIDIDGSDSADGTLSRADNVDVYRVSITQGEVLTMRTTGNTHTVGTLYDSAGTVIRSDGGGEESNFLFKELLTRGVYYILVRGDSFSAGDYKLLASFQPPVSIGILDSVDGSISPVGDEDYYRITITEKGFLIVQTTSGMDTVGTLYNGIGRAIGFDDDHGEQKNFLFEELLNPGTYYIKVAAFSFATTGSYKLRTSFETSITIDLLDSVNETIFPIGNLDIYKVKVARTGFFVAQTTGNTHIKGTLYDNAGRQITSDDGGAEANFRIEALLSPGIYYIGVDGLFPATTGDYTLQTFFEIPSAIGRSDSANETISSVEDFDYWTLKVDQIGFVTMWTTGDTNTKGTLYDVIGKEITSDDNDGEGNNFFLTQIVFPATYYIGVSSAAGAGNYTLNTSFEIPIPIGISDLADEKPVSRVQAIDAYTFTVPEAGFITLETIGNTNTAGTLYNSIGEVINGFQFGSTRLILPGTYYLKVVISSIGSYGLRTSYDPPISIETPDSVSEAIFPAGDMDIYTIVVRNAGSLTLQTSGSSDTQGRLLDSTGRQLSFDDDSGPRNNFLIRRFVPPGTYHIVVKGFSSRTGDYTLHSSFFTDPITTIDLSSATDEAISPAGDEDYYTLTVAERGFLVIQTTGNTNTRGTLYDGARIRISSDDDSGEGMNFRMVRSVSPGTYYIGIAGDPGSYRLQTSFAIPADISISEPVNENISSAGDIDYWTLRVNQASVVTVQTSGNTDTRGILYDGELRELTLDDDRGEGDNFLVTEVVFPGTYYIEVSSSSDTGNYTLNTSFEIPTSIGIQDSADEANISRAEDIDIYTFTAPQAGLLTLRTTGETNTQGILYNSMGERLCLKGHLYDSVGAETCSIALDGEGNDFERVRFVLPGDYYLRVTGNGSASGSYRLQTFFKLPINLDPPDSINEAVSSATDIDIYAIDASFTSSMFVSNQGSLILQTTGGTDTRGILLNSAGTEISSDNSSGEGEGNFRIEESVSSGTYYILVRGDSPTTTGDYILHSSLFLSPTTIDLSQRVSQHSFLKDGRRQHYYKLTVAEQGFLIIQTESSNQGAVNPDTLGTLYDGLGRAIISDDDSGGGVDFRIIHLVSPGTYYIGVTRKTTDSLYIYNLYASHKIPVSIETPGSINAAISRRDIDIYAITVRGFLVSQLATSNEGSLILQTTGNTDTAAILFDSAGMEIISSGSGGEGNNFRIERSVTAGTYYIAVIGDSASTTGDYTLHSSFFVPPITPIDLGLLRAQVILNQPSQIDVDYYTLTVDEQGFLTVQTTGNTDTIGSLYNSLARAIISDDDSGEGKNFRIKQLVTAGTYFIRVTGKSAEGSSSLYNLKTSFEPLTPISIPSSVNEDISSAEDEDYYALTVDEQGFLIIRITNNADIILLDSEASEVSAYISDGEEGDLSLEALVSPGTYYLRVSSSVGTPAYILSTSFELPTAIEISEPVSGSIFPAGDRDYYSLMVDQIGALSGKTTGGDSTNGVLFNSAGTLIGAADNASGEEGNFLLTEPVFPATYYIGVSSFSSPDNYTLNTSFETPSVIDALNSTTEADLSSAGDLDIYRITVLKTGLLTISTIGDTQNSLYDDRGTEIIPDGEEGGVFQFANLQSGTYYILVVGSPLLPTDAYTLHTSFNASPP